MSQSPTVFVGLSVYRVSFVAVLLIYGFEAMLFIFF